MYFVFENPEIFAGLRCFLLRSRSDQLLGAGGQTLLLSPVLLKVLEALVLDWEV